MGRERTSNFEWVALAVRESDLPHLARTVLLAIALRARGTRGYCNARRSTLASDTGLSPTTVKRAIRVLIEKGWLTCEVGSRNMRTYYVKAESGLSAPSGLSDPTESGLTDPTEGGSRVSQTRQSGPTDPTHGSQSQRNLGQEVESSDDSPSGSGLLKDPEWLARDTSVPRRRELAALLQHSLPADGFYGFSDQDMHALIQALSQGYTLDELKLVWDYFTTKGVEGDSQWAKDKGWAWSWATIANQNLGPRLQTAQRWADDPQNLYFLPY